MSDAAKSLLRVALAGNPNAGKTSLFNALTGAHHKVGNYPGVTVEKREGSRIRDGREYRFIDLPGIYSLTAYSIDEVVARDFILDEKPDLIVDVLDSTNLERNLFLCLQFQELGIPVVGALNMSDEAAAKGIKIDVEALSAVLGIPMVKTVGSKGNGVDDLLDSMDAAAGDRQAASFNNSHAAHSIHYGQEIESRVEAPRGRDRCRRVLCRPLPCALARGQAPREGRERLRAACLPQERRRRSQRRRRNRSPGSRSTTRRTPR